MSVPTNVDMSSPLSVNWERDAEKRGLGLVKLFGR